MKKIVVLSLVASSVLMASGYQIPENSINSTALADAYVANANGADAAYYNPANMVFSDNKGSDLEIDMTYIGLSAMDYKGSTAVQGVGIVQKDTSSKTEAFLVPTLHYVSPAVDNFRFGLSVVSPAGLSKRWTDSPASVYSKEFTLKTIEINPSVAYKFNEQFAVALGVRGVYSSGIVDNAYYYLSGTGFDWGYNLALTYKPMKDTNIALTYRSKVDLHVSGDATNIFTDGPRVDSGVKVSLPVPASVNLAISHTYNNATTVEFVLERTMWSAYKNLDFDFDNLSVYAPLQAPQVKNWKDTNAYRLGLTHKFDKLTAMAGFAYDTTPVPNSSIGYELPDSDGKLISLGARYAFTDQLSVGLAGLISFKDNKSVNNLADGGYLNGEFSNSRAYLVTTGLEYKF